RTVQAGQQGIIKNIKVKVNQLVLRGDEIALLEDSSLQTQRSQLIGNIQQNKLQLERSAFELKALQEQIAAESQSTQEEVESATAELKRNQRDYQERQVTTSLEVKEAEASLELARSEMEQYEQLKDTGALSELQIQQKEQAYKVALSRLQKAKAGLDPSSANITIARARITQQIAKGKSTLAILEREHQELMRRKVEIQNQINSFQLFLEKSKTNYGFITRSLRG
ncbi:MAG: biotin/lipoyl-binding protein, partial [Microcystis panniformis]